MAKSGRAAPRAAAVSATQSIKIDGGQSTEIGGTQAVAIGKDRQVKIVASDTLSIGLDQAIAVGRALTLTVGGDATVEIGGGVTLSATKVTLRALQELRLEVGASQLIVKPSGDIQLKGNRIEISGSAEVHLRGSSVRTN